MQCGGRCTSCRFVSVLNEMPNEDALLCGLSLTSSLLLHSSFLWLAQCCAFLCGSTLSPVSRKQTRTVLFFFLRVIAIVVVERLTSHPVTSAHPQLTASSFSFSSIDGSDVSQTDSCSCSVGRNGRLEHRRFFDNGHSALVRYEE